MSDEPYPRRRDPDDTILPIVMLQVEDRLREERHALRNELAAIAANVSAGQSQASREHAEVKAELAELRHCVEPIPRLVKRVDHFEEAGAFEEGRNNAATAFRQTAWRICGVLIAFIGAMTGVLALLMNH